MANKDLIEKCEKIYNDYGSSGVIDYCNSINHTEWDYCLPCDSVNPVVGGICLVCGSPIKKGIQK